MCLPINKCCFCISLEAGTKIISILSLLYSMAAVVVYGGAAMSLPAAAQSRQCFYMLMVLISLSHVTTCSLLIYGAFWSKPCCLRPWLVTSWISCGILVLLSLLGVVLLTLQYSDNMVTLADISNMSTFYFICAAILYYCATVVQSRRTQMIRAQETETANTLMRDQHFPKNLLV